MEDVWQILLQYFFVDKFSGQSADAKQLVAYNAVFMLIRALFFVKGLFPLFERKMKSIRYVLQAMLPLAMQIARLVGSFQQVFFVAPRVKGACLQYDYKEAAIRVNPFTTQCLDHVDYVLIGTAVLTCSIFIFEAIYIKFSITSSSIIIAEAKDDAHGVTPAIGIMNLALAVRKYSMSHNR